MVPVALSPRDATYGGAYKPPNLATLRHPLTLNQQLLQACPWQPTRLQLPPWALAAFVLLGAAARGAGVLHATTRLLRGTGLEAQERAGLSDDARLPEQLVVCSIRAPGLPWPIEYSKYSV